MSKQLQRLIAELKAQKEITAVFERGQQNACDGEDAAKEYAASLKLKLKAAIERAEKAGKLLDWIISQLNKPDDLAFRDAIQAERGKV